MSNPTEFIKRWKSDDDKHPLLQEAIGHIEQLLNPWTAVGDGLPEVIHNTEYYVRVEGLSQEASGYTSYETATFNPKTKKFYQWTTYKGEYHGSEIFNMSSNITKHRHITHWAEIPQLPEKP